MASLSDIRAEIQTLQGDLQTIDEIRNSFSIICNESQKKYRASQLWHARQAIRIMEPEVALDQAKDLYKRICGLEHLNGDCCVPVEAVVDNKYVQYVETLNTLVSSLDGVSSLLSTC